MITTFGILRTRATDDGMADSYIVVARRCIDDNTFKITIDWLATKFIKLPSSTRVYALNSKDYGIKTIGDLIRLTDFKPLMHKPQVIAIFKGYLTNESDQYGHPKPQKFILIKSE